MIKRAVDPGIRFGHDKGAVGKQDLEQDAADVSISGGVERRRGIAACVEYNPVLIQELVEGRQHVAPRLAAVHRKIVPAFIESYA